MGDSPIAQRQMPEFTWPQRLALFVVVAYVILVALPNSAVNSEELDELKKLAILVIAGLLPSDGVIRFARSHYAAKREEEEEKGTGDTKKAKEKVKDELEQTPMTTPIQIGVVGLFLVAAALAILFDGAITDFSSAVEVAAFGVVALMPSEAVIRVGRALYAKGTPGAATADELKKM
jgi:hypothetical protein